ncbi:MAG: Uma2 family endonuclease [Planctomycetaceae bacterium]
MALLNIPVPTSLGPDSNGLMLTPEQFDAIADWDDSYRYELVHGVVIVALVAGEGERCPNELLGNLLWDYQQNHALGSCLDHTVYEQYVQTVEGRRLADRVLWIGLGHRPDVNREFPTIPVEFVSNTARDRRRDYVEKRDEYLEAGAKEYWVIDRFDRTLTAFFANGEHRVIAAGETYETPLLPGFVLPLERLFAAADLSGEQ